MWTDAEATLGTFGRYVFDRRHAQAAETARWAMRRRCRHGDTRLGKPQPPPRSAQPGRLDTRLVRGRRHGQRCPLLLPHHGLVSGIDLWVAYWTGSPGTYYRPEEPAHVPDQVAALRPRWWQYTSGSRLAGYADLSTDPTRGGT